MNDKEKDKLMDARCRIQISHPWYGTFCTRIDWIERSSIKTVGVNFGKGGRVNCFYNKEWCNQLSIDALIAVIMHEIEHIIRMHPVRSIGSTNQHHVIHNVAQDWLINGYKDRKLIDNLPDCGMFAPSNADKKLWEGINIDFFNTLNHTSEETAKWIVDNTTIIQNDKGWALVLSNGNILHIELHDDHNVWAESDASRDEIRQTVKDIVNATNKIAGKPPGHLQEQIQKIQTSKVHYTHLFRNLIGRSIGQKRKTFSRINRKRPIFGVKGTSSHGGNKLTILCDVSGSMHTKILEVVFGEIEAMSQKFKITLIEFDSKVQKVTDYKRGDWRNINIIGRGGTDFGAALDYIEEHNLVADANIILTDGLDTIPNKRDYNVIWAIVGSSNFARFKEGKCWGDLLEISGDF